MVNADEDFTATDDGVEDDTDDGVEDATDDGVEDDRRDLTRRSNSS
jgi:hypothetical protein